MILSDACAEDGAHPHGICHQRNCGCPCHLVLARYALEHYGFTAPAYGDVNAYRRWLKLGTLLVQSDYVQEWEN